MSGNIKKLKFKSFSLAYTEEGKGETILMVHGITTYSFIWRKVIPLLSQKYRVIAVDLLGCGNSDKPLDVDYSIKNQADIIYEFAKELGLQNIHLVTHDIGGGIGQIITAKYPEMISDLTLINTVAYDFWPVQPIIAMRTPIIRQLAMATLDLGTFKIIVKRGLYHKEKLTKELMELFWKPMKTRIGRKAFLHLAECLNNQNLLEIQNELHNTKIRVMIIRGDADVYLSKTISEKLHENIPGSFLVKIKTAGHFLMEDEPEKTAMLINQQITNE